MKAADIPDEDFLALVAAIQEAKGGWALVWDVEALTGYPDKVVRAKARKLIRRGLMDGCACGCRGDFDVIDGWTPTYLDQATAIVATVSP